MWQFADSLRRECWKVAVSCMQYLIDYRYWLDDICVDYIKISVLMIFFDWLLFRVLTDGILNYIPMSNVPLWHLVMSVFLSTSQIIVQLLFSFCFFFVFGRKKLSFSFLFRFSAENDTCIVFFGPFIFRSKTKSHFRSASRLSPQTMCGAVTEQWASIV